MIALILCPDEDKPYTDDTGRILLDIKAGSRCGVLIDMTISCEGDGIARVKCEAGNCSYDDQAWYIEGSPAPYRWIQKGLRKMYQLS